MRINITADGHEHAGLPAPKGTVLDVDEATGRWLVEQRIGTPVPPPKQEPEPAEAKPEKSK